MKNLKLGIGSYISDNVKIGNNVVIGNNTVIDGEGFIGDNVKIGHGAIFEGNFKIGKDNILGHYLIIKGSVEIGDNNNCESFVTLGTEPQDLNATGKDTKVIIGNKNVLREYVTVHRGTQGNTVIGNENYIMTNVTINHDCILGNNTILTTQSILGGYVEIQDYGYVGFGAACHQFTRIGKYAFVGMNGRVTRDVPPFVIATNEPLKVARVNSIGLNRKGFSDERIKTIENFYKKINDIDDKKKQSDYIIKELNQTSDKDLLKIFNFYKSASRRGILWI